MSDCLNIYELIHKELDEELTKEELKFLEHHCRYCFTCQKLREEYSHTIQCLEILPMLEPEEGFMTSVLNAVDNIPDTKKLFKYSRYTNLFAGLTLIFTSGFLLFSSLLLITCLGLGVIVLNRLSSTQLTDNLYHWLMYFADLFNAVFDAFTLIFSPVVLGSVFLVSLISFIVLTLLLFTRRTIYHEN